MLLPFEDFLRKECFLDVSVLYKIVMNHLNLPVLYIFYFILVTAVASGMSNVNIHITLC